MAERDWSLTAADNDDADSGINLNGTTASIRTADDSMRAIMQRRAIALADTNGSRATTGSSNTYAYASAGAGATPADGWSAYATGDKLLIEANHSNTGAATLNVDSVGAKAIRRQDDTALQSGDMISGGKYLLVYDEDFNSSAGAWVLLNRNVGSGVPSGAVMAFAMETAPTGWLECNGDAVSRTTYADLFAAIGTVHGVGNGSTTFNLPDYRGEFLHRKSSDYQSDGADTLVTRRQIAEQAGMSVRQQLNAVRVSRVPEKDFEAAVESDSPPTITKLAKMGTMTREQEIERRVQKFGHDYMEGRTGAEFRQVMDYLNPLEDYAKWCRENPEFDAILEVLTDRERAEIRSHIETIDRMHDKISTRI